MRSIRSPLDGFPSPFGVRRGAAALLASTALLGSEPDGIAFVGEPTATHPYGTLTIRDTVTPANNYEGHPFVFQGGKLAHSRSGLGMNTGSDGLVKYANHNFVVQSQAYDNASWTKSNITVSQDTGDTTDPDGSNQAAKLIASVDGVSTAHNINNAVTISLGGVVRVVAKAGTASWLQLSNSSYRAWFNLSAGVVGTVQNGTTSIEALGGGWYQCVWTPADVTQTNTLRIWITNADNATNYQGNGETLYVYTAQQQALPCHSEDYIPTTTAAVHAPRIDYDPTTLIAKGLLMEEARTNPVLHSRDLTNAAWVKTSTTAAKTATGIDGVANSASTLTATSGNGHARQTIVSASAQRISSLYVKRRTGSGAVTLAHGDTTGSNLVTNGTFDTNIAGWTQVGGGSHAWDASGGIACTDVAGADCNSQASITTVVGKLYKISWTVVSKTGGGDQWLVRVRNSVDFDFNSFSGAGNYSGYFVASGVSNTVNLLSATTGATVVFDNISVTEVVETTLAVTNNWTRVNTPAATITDPNIIIKLATSGDAIDVDVVQCEAGAFVTSPIITTTASVTRAADTCSIATTLFNYNQSLGTFMLGIVPLTSHNGSWFMAGTSTSFNPGSIGFFGMTTSFFTRAGSAYTASVATASSLVVGAFNKMAGVYKTDSVKTSVNGSAVGTAVPPNAMPTTVNGFDFSTAGVTGVRGAMTLSVFLYAPREFSNAELQALTAA